MASIITLLTDFGSHDSYVAEMKAALLAGAPDAVLVDITHEVMPGDIRAAQYLLDRSWRRFPNGTVHLTVVDPEVGTARRALAASAGGQFFVAPDNGLLTPVLDGARVMELAVPRDASPTFHGRDVFAPAAARLAMGARLADLGVTVDDAIRFPLPAPREVNGALVGEVIYVDRFGTLVTNFPEWMLSGGDRLHLGGSAVTVGRTFGDVERGGLVAFVGSGGTVEIAVRDGSAARTLGAGVGGEVRLERLS